MFGMNVDRLIHLTYKDIPHIMKQTGFPQDKVLQYFPYVKQVEQKFVRLVHRAYPVVVEIVKKYNVKTICEVGVAFGNQSLEIIEKCNIKKLYGVDTYKHYPSSEYKDPMNLPQPLFDLIYCLVDKRFKAAGATLIRAPSIKAARLFANHSLDMVYIDANHTYQGVKDDLAAWYDKVKPGGIISGDDYGGSVFLGVTKAVDEFIAQYNLTMHRDLAIEYRTWWAEKPI